MRRGFALIGLALGMSLSSLALAQGAEPVPAETPPPPPDAVPPPPPPAQAAPAAQPMAPPPPAQPAPPPEAPDSSKRRHDGFYMRFGLGGGALSMTRDASAESTA